MKYVIYIRVSTKKQGASGLGLEAQRKICSDFINSKGGEMVAEFMDVESGTHRDRKGLAQAVEYCKREKCALVLAKLDRLARDVEFCFRIVNTGIEIHFCDMPSVNTLLLGVFASVAQYERELTSDRTKKALQAKKARGEATGGASQKWRESFNAKSDTDKANSNKERGKSRSHNYLERKDTQAFFKVLRNVFPAETALENPKLWQWNKINTKGTAKRKMLSLMHDYHDFDGTLFEGWDFSEKDNVKMQVKLSGLIGTIKRSVMNYYN